MTGSLASGFGIIVFALLQADRVLATLVRSGMLPRLVSESAAGMGVASL